MKNKTDEDQLEQSVPKIDTRIAAVRDLILEKISSNIIPSLKMFTSVLHL